MTYEETIEYLFTAAPLFQNIGAGAYKEGLSTTVALDEHFHHPHHQYRTIHIGGTNGKGSVSHTLAAILQQSGLKVGLYTSPHLIDFRERIRINGTMIPKQRVVDFVERERAFFEPLHPSFFELTTALVFLYFAEERVDVAVIEVGLGGRLDCTNIIHPDLSLVTNISFDHVQFLGDTLEKIAAEKAGIIKPHVPFILGESDNEAVTSVFRNAAHMAHTSLTLADKETYSSFGNIQPELQGFCQERNTQTILAAVTKLKEVGYLINNTSVREGFAHVTRLTGLMGRWQTLSNDPLTICDTGHNVGGMRYIVQQLRETPHRQLHIIIGMVNDKDINAVLSMLPQEATYYFTQASVKRALPVGDFAKQAAAHGLHGTCHDCVAGAYLQAKDNAMPDDLIFIGGSTFIVADMLKSMV